jgi:hypothetical protein
MTFGIETCPMLATTTTDEGKQYVAIVAGGEASGMRSSNPYEREVMLHVFVLPE